MKNKLIQGLSKSNKRSQKILKRTRLCLLKLNNQWHLSRKRSKTPNLPR